MKVKETDKVQRGKELLSIYVDKSLKKFQREIVLCSDIIRKHSFKFLSLSTSLQELHWTILKTYQLQNMIFLNPQPKPLEADIKQTNEPRNSEQLK